MRRSEENRQGCGAILIFSAIDGHRNGRIVVLEAGKTVAPKFTSSEVTVVGFKRKVHMYSRDMMR